MYLSQLQMAIEFVGIIVSFIVCSQLARSHKARYIHGRIMLGVMASCCLFLVCDTIAIRYRGSPGAAAGAAVLYANYGAFLFQYLLLFFIGLFIHLLFRDREPRGLTMTGIGLTLCLLVLAGLGLNPFLHHLFIIAEGNLYVRGPLFGLTMGLTLLLIVFYLLPVIIYRKTVDRDDNLPARLLSVFIAPTLACLVQLFVYGLSLTAIGLCISSVMLTLRYGQFYDLDQQKLRDKLMESRASLLSAQIQPHFLFNSLSVIQSLLSEDTEEAKRAIEQLRKFLNTGLSHSAGESMVPWEKELEYTREYLYIQQLRFGNRLQVCYELEEIEDFCLPLLTVEPLVENAVSHGLRKKLEGGTVTIRLFDTEENYVVQVADDGVGFDPSRPVQPDLHQDSNGVGLQNVRERLALICDGTLTLDSSPGEGTTATITIPHRQNAAAYHGGRR